MRAIHRLSSLAVPFMPLARDRQQRAVRSQPGGVASQVVEPALLHARFDQRLRERARIARELHDTLLQGTQALMLSVKALLVRTQPDDPTYGMLVQTLRRADALMVEGLDRIQNLRADEHECVDLARSLTTAWRELGGRAELHMLVEGSPHSLDASIGDEVSLIGREAFSNAVRHASARRVEVRIVHCSNQLLLRIRDDGVGMAMHNPGGRAGSGHWGLQGMRERAVCVGGRLTIWSAPGTGTEIELTVPSTSGYHHASAQSR